MSRMRNLTLASAKHLMNMGHITPEHHAKILKASALPKLPTLPKMKGLPKTPAFGALAKPQQAQAPIPGIGDEPSYTPPGTSSGY